MRHWMYLRAALALLVAACTPADDESRSLERISVAFVAQLPPNDAVTDSVIFLPIDIEAVANGLVVADEAGPTIRRIDLSGELINVLGRKGRGPGEFSSLEGIATSPDGTLLAVSDARNRRVSTLGNEGTVRTEILIETPGRVGALAFDSDGNVHVDRRGAAGGTRRGGSPTITVFSPTGEFLRSYGAYVPGEEPWGDRLLNEARFAPSIRGMWVLLPYQGLARHYDASGEVSDSIVLPPPEGRPAGGPFIEADPGNPNAVSLVRMPVADDIAVDDAGRVFVVVLQTPQGQPMRTDLYMFDTAGKRSGTIALRKVARRIAIGGSTLFAMRDPNIAGTGSIHLYSIDVTPP